jgi:hypothetical protein
VLPNLYPFGALRDQREDRFHDELAGRCGSGASAKQKIRYSPQWLGIRSGVLFNERAQFIDSNGRHISIIAVSTKVFSMTILPTLAGLGRKLAGFL